MRFTVITPCYNAGACVEETIRSVINQKGLASGKFELEYIICDGGSTDETCEVIKSINSPLCELLSEPDRGMYDALAKGLRRCSGDVISYLNAGDLYHPSALEVISQIFSEYPGVHWLTGWNVIYNQASQITDMRLPYRYRRKFFSNGLHGRVLPTLQQESTFWRAKLNNLVDLDRLSKFKLAGDYYLWLQFSRRHQPMIVGTHLGGFKIHHGQLTGETDAYGREFRLMIEKPRWWEWPLAWLDWSVWKLMPPGVKQRLNRGEHFVYNQKSEKWELFSERNR